jgi:hypothetical protein
MSMLLFANNWLLTFFKVVSVMGGFAEWVDGVMGLRVGFININDMYNNDVGKGVVCAYEAYEVK